MSIRIYLAEDQSMLRGALAALLALESDFEIVGQAADGESAWREIRQSPPDVLVADIEMPRWTGLELAQHIQQADLPTRVLILTTFARPGYLRRALEAVPEQPEGAEDNGLKTLVEGVELTERAMLSALERHGVRKVEPKGQKFDPNFHQAMYEVPNVELPNNTVIDVVQPGYVIGDRMLRPAMVGVSKGGPKETAAAPEPGAPTPESEKDA